MAWRRSAIRHSVVDGCVVLLAPRIALMGQVLCVAGYADVRSEVFTVTFEFPSVAELQGHLGDVSAVVRAILATQTPQQQAAFWQRLASAPAGYADADGTIRLRNESLIVAGQRPV